MLIGPDRALVTRLGLTLACLVGLALRASPALAEGSNMQLVGHLGPIGVLALQNGIAYAGEGRQVVALDVHDPAHIVQIGAGPFFPGPISQITIEGHYAYVAASGTHVLDIANPAQLAEVGSMPDGGVAIRVVGSRAYALGKSGLSILDIGNPAKPSVIGSFPITYPTDGEVRSLALSGTTAYVGAISVSSAKGPSLGGGLFVIDVSNATRPSLVQRVPGSVGSLFASGTYLYESTFDSNHFQMLDISTPSAPKVIAGSPTPMDVQAVSSNLLYASTAAGFQAFDAADPLHPRPLGTYQTSLRFGHASFAQVDGRRGYVTGGGQLHVLDVSAPDHLTELGSFSGPMSATTIAFSGANAYVADGFLTALNVLNISEPSRPFEIGAYDFGTNTSPIIVSGAYAFGAGLSAAQILDISNPSSPRLVATIPLTPGPAGAPLGARLAVSDSHLFMTDAVAGLRIFDISDPAHPAQIGSWFGGGGSDITLRGSYVYVADHQNLVTIDVSDAAQPKVIGYTPLPDRAFSFALDGQRLYTRSSTSVQIIDLSNPAQPALAGSITGLTSVNGPAASGGLLAVMTDTAVLAFDVTDPAHPRQTGSFDLRPDSGGGVAVKDGLIYAGTLSDGLFILRASLPHDDRYFPQTGFRVDNDTIWDYFQHRGGVATFGYPTSRMFLFQGFTVQFFQRRIVQLAPDGSARQLNLLDPGLLPYTSFHGSTFPGADPALVASAPDPTNQPAVLAWVQQHAPDSVAGAPVNFFQTFSNTVSADVAFPSGGGNAGLLAGIDLEMWGVPTSAPMTDPIDHNFIYQRWQRGIMHYDAGCGCTEGILLGDYLKDILTGQHLPADLAQEAATSPLLNQHDPNAPHLVRDPSRLPDTDMTNAFVPE